ncbi:hypothetical protein L9F63_016894, partial [Diploptera punctata]
ITIWVSLKSLLISMKTLLYFLFFADNISLVQEWNLPIHFMAVIWIVTLETPCISLIVLDVKVTSALYPMERLYRRYCISRFILNDNIMQLVSIFRSITLHMYMNYVC